MSKYAPLADYLKKQSRDRVPLTFAEIEKITGVRLPPSATRHRPWWSNNPNNSVMTRVWLDAGFESGEVDMAARKLVFTRVRGGNDTPVERRHHPAYGALKGLMRIMPGTDLTQPADPDLADYLDAKYGPETR